MRRITIAVALAALIVSAWSTFRAYRAVSEMNRVTAQMWEIEK